MFDNNKSGLNRREILKKGGYAGVPLSIASKFESNTVSTATYVTVGVRYQVDAERTTTLCHLPTEGVDETNGQLKLFGADRRRFALFRNNDVVVRAASESTNREIPAPADVVPAAPVEYLPIELNEKLDTESAIGLRRAQPLPPVKVDTTNSGAVSVKHPSSQATVSEVTVGVKQSHVAELSSIEVDLMVTPPRQRPNGQGTRTAEYETKRAVPVIEVHNFGELTVKDATEEIKD